MHLMKPGGRFYWLRLHSLSGVVPVGLFVLMHLYTNSFSLKGPQAFDARLATLNQLPFMEAFKQNLFLYPNLGNVRYTLQRLSGIGVLLFVGAHVYKTKIEPWMGGFSID